METVGVFEFLSSTLKILNLRIRWKYHTSCLSNIWNVGGTHGFSSHVFSTSSRRNSHLSSFLTSLPAGGTLEQLQFSFHHQMNFFSILDEPTNGKQLVEF